MRESYIRAFLYGLAALALAVWFGYDAFFALDKTGQRKFDPDRTPAYFAFNAGMSFILPLVGVVMLVLAARLRGRVLAADAEGLGYIGKSKIAWQSLRKLDPRAKGLLDVYYEDASGSEKRLKLDSLKVSRFNELVAFIEAKAPNCPVTGRTEKANPKH